VINTDEPKILDFFIAGGTLRPNSPSYVKRPADDELFKLVLASEFCYILTARQMGKSSLMIRTAKRLQEIAVRVAIIDLTTIGTVTIDTWYLGLLTELSRTLRLTVNPADWWDKRASLGPVQRFTSFLRDVVLVEIEGQVAFFIDEIDTTLNLDFRDDFFAAIRAMYNARATDPAYQRLTFVLLGVATPSDLIKDHARTPFNIGQAIDLREFSREDAAVLKQGLVRTYPGEGEAIFTRVFHWTNGHPYLTQKLCATAANNRNGPWDNGRLDILVEKLFLSEEARRETNLRFVRENVTASPRRRQLLSLYRKVYQGKTVPEDEGSLDQNRLKLVALVGAKNGRLQVRNEIYRRAFNLDWIKANTPLDWNRWIAVAAVVIALVLGFYIWQQGQQTTDALAQTYTDNFNNTTNSVLRLGALANLFGLEGYEDEARTLFDMLSPDDKIALFANATPDLQPQVRAVVRGTYTHLDDMEANNRLLQAMQATLEQSDEAESKLLVIEIGHWLRGRAALAAKNYEEAKQAYSAAIQTNDKNPATYFERAGVLTHLEDYPGALTDFEAMLTLNEDWRERVRQAVESNEKLHSTWWNSRNEYPSLSALVSTPTNTPTPTSTPTPTPTPIPTATPTVTSTPNPPTATPSPNPATATPTLLSSTATPTPTAATATPRPPAPPTATPTPPALTGQFTLLKPTLGDTSTGSTEFEWRWDGPLGPDQGFEVRVWREGEPPAGAHNAVEDNKNGYVAGAGNSIYRISLNIRDAAGVRGRGGEYLWTVVLIQVSPEYKDLGIQASPGRLSLGLGGGGGGGDGGGGGFQ
jgi:tetratricopeptide (TPR) repeat protein